MKFCHIAPTPYIDSVAEYSGCFLTLAHLVEKDPEYCSAHLRAYLTAHAQDRDIVRIMDNSGFEFYKEYGTGYVFDPVKLIDLGAKIGAEYIVLPDYPAQHSSVTINGAIQHADAFKSHGFGTFFCPQSRIGDIGDYINCVRWASQSPLIDYIGISILGVPNAFGVEQNKLQRYVCRHRLMQLLFEQGILDTIWTNGKKIHFLGMVDGPNEIALMETFSSYINSWDSSAAVWAGINGILFDNSPTGLINGKLEIPVDFNAPYEVHALQDALSNISYINALIDKVI